MSRAFITLLTSAGAVRVAGDSLVIDLRELEKPAGPSRPVTAPEPSTASPEARATHFPAHGLNPDRVA